MCLERRRVSLDPGSVHNLWGCNAAAGIHGVWGGKPAAGERGGPLHQVSLMRGLAWPVGGMPTVSRGDDAGPSFPLICMYPPGLEWILY